MTLSPQEALAKALHGPMQAAYWYADGVAAELSKMTGAAMKLWWPEAYARDLHERLTAAGYVLVPVKETLTVERVAEALQTIWAAGEANSWKGGAPCKACGKAILLGMCACDEPTYQPEIPPVSTYYTGHRWLLLDGLAAALLAALKTSEVTE